jgi:hypothetical protein
MSRLGGGALIAQDTDPGEEGRQVASRCQQRAIGCQCSADVLLRFESDPIACPIILIEFNRLSANLSISPLWQWRCIRNWHASTAVKGWS